MKSTVTWLSTTVLVLLFCSASLVLSAQEEPRKVSIDASADIMSRYIWRGMNLGGSSPSIQPNLELATGNFALGAWGAYSINPSVSHQEVDLYASYTIADRVTLSATDYFLPNEDTLPNRYFNFKKDETGHLIELSFKLTGTEKLPFSLLVATNIYGADARKANGDLRYSTYLELGYDFTVSGTECNAFLGFTPTKTGTGETGYYGTGPGVINLGITANREIRITDTFSLPVNASLITNPQAENIFLVFGISL